jgi:hypothetical protein
MEQKPTPEIRIPDSKMHIPRGYEKKVHTGPVLAVFIIVILLILGGLYLWGASLTKNSILNDALPLINNEPETPRAIADKQIFEVVSPSDDLNAIEIDIESTNFNILEEDVSTIEVELDAALRE